MTRMKWIASALLFLGVCFGCASPGPIGDTREFSVEELFPVVDGRVWVFDVIDVSGSAKDTCRVSLQEKSVGGPWAIEGHFAKKEASFRGSLRREGEDLVLSYGQLGVSILREPVRDGARWQFRRSDPRTGDAILGKASVLFETTDPTLPDQLQGKGPTVSVVIQITSGRTRSYEGYRFLPGVGFTAIRHSEDGRRWTEMKLVGLESASE